MTPSYLNSPHPITTGYKKKTKKHRDIKNKENQWTHCGCSILKIGA